MARFASVNLTRSTGFDEERGLLVMQAGKKAELYLVAGENLNVYTEDPDLVSISSQDKDVAAAHKSTEVTPGEKGQTIRLVTLKAGNRQGTTELRAGTGGVGWAGPVDIRVVQGADRRQVGRAIGEVTPELREELAQLTLREAVTRIAEDQMNSAVCLGNGFGKYMVATIAGKAADWCGGFAYWCWQQAAAIKGVENPFGDNNEVLWSPQRAIGWAMQNPDKAVVLRYKGGNPGPSPFQGKQEWHDIGWNGYSLERADIVMVRAVSTGPKDDGWRHVTQIDWVGESVLHTIDGNQGNGRCIKRRTYNTNKKLTNGQYQLAFLHVLV
jgi:hypothetical protein